MRDYEITMIVNPELGEENVGSATEKLSQFIGNGGGEVTKIDPWGRRRLAYPIDGHREGFYFVTHFKMEPRATTELERNLKLTEEIVRYLIVRLGD